MNAFEQMRRRDVGHVERRILTQQHDLPVPQMFRTRVRKVIVVAGDIAHIERVPARQQPVAVK